MIRATQQWDVRCPDALKTLLSPRRGYWFKVDRVKAQQICDILSDAYGIPHLEIQPSTPPASHDGFHAGGKLYGMYQAGKAWVHGRAHVKSVFHEWYHHLDYCTHGKYDSKDRQGGSSSYGWQFGDRMFDALKVPIAK